MMILDWIKEFFDPFLLLTFSIMFGYCLIADVPSLRRKKLYREAKVIAVMAWSSIGLCLGLLVLVVVT